MDLITSGSQLNEKKENQFNQTQALIIATKKSV